MSNLSYREKLKQRQMQEHADKGKTGLGRKSVFDYGKALGKEVNFFQPRYLPEKNAIDIIPFIITQDWYRKLRSVSGRPVGLEAGDRDYKLQIPVHRNIGAGNDTYLCLREAFGGPCIVCDEMFEAYKVGDKAKSSDLRAGWRCFYNIYDYDDAAKGIQLFEISFYNFEGTSKNDPQRCNLIDKMMLDSGGPMLFSDLEEGKTLVVQFKKMLMGKNDYPQVSEIVFEDRDSYTEDILRQVYPLDAMLIIPRPDEVETAYFDLDVDGVSDEVPEKEKESPPSEKRTRQSQPAQEIKTKESASPVQPSRRGRALEPVQVEKKEPDAPAWDKEGNWGHCPAGKAFGKDCNTGPECEGKTDNSCDEKIFEACSAAYMEIQSGGMKEEPVKEPAKEPVKEPAKEPVKESEPPVTGRRRR